VATHKNRPLPVRFGFALRGIAHALSSEASLKFQAAAGLLAFLLLLLLRPAALWWALLALACAAVLAAELFNTAIEQLADALHPHEHPRIAIAKDCAAAAVLLAVLGALGVAAAFIAHMINN
jgi:undecaprenol kinase